MKTNVKHIILCGGAGTRLWPLSHAEAPKQLLTLFGGKSLLQLTMERNKNIAGTTTVLVNSQLMQQVQAQLATLADVSSVHWIAEPMPRNTAAAIAIAALLAPPESILLVTPSDHLIPDVADYEKTITQAVVLAQQGFLITLGLKPTHPETGYGYIRHQGNEVLNFTEKPDKTTAESFIHSSNYLWNSGIFCFRAADILQELNIFAPHILQASTVAVEELHRTGAISAATMQNIPAQSIDYAVMEKSKRIKVVPTSMSWSDVGSYEALVEALQIYNIKSDLYFPSNAENNDIFTANRPIAIIGVSDLIVVDSPKGLLILKKGTGQEVKEVYEQIKNKTPQNC